MPSLPRQVTGKRTPVELPLLVTADDRTGALEVGGAVADLGFTVRLARTPTRQDDCLLLDVASRHVEGAEAGRRVAAAHSLPARHRCHKMDSGLRGNWVHEVAALLGAGHRVGVIASYPDAGRRCRNGTVFVHGVPVAEGPLGRDPRNPLPSSRPEDYLRAAGCDDALRDGGVVVLDADDNSELGAAAMRCHAESRLPVGATGALAAYAAVIRNRTSARPPTLPRPALVVCGSLHPLSRRQIASLPAAQFDTTAIDLAEHELRQGKDAVLATAKRPGPIAHSIAEAMAGRVAASVQELLTRGVVGTLVILGGDTAGAILQGRSLQVLGCVATGVSVSRFEGNDLSIVTKGGSIGDENTLCRILA